MINNDNEFNIIQAIYFVRTLIELLIVYQRILKNGSSKCYYCIFTMYRESEVKWSSIFH